MMLRPYNISHPTYIRVVDEAHDGSFTGSSNLFGVICAISIRLTSVFVSGLSRDDFDRDLYSRLVAETRYMGTETESYLFASLQVLCQLHFAHTAGTNGLSQTPSPCLRVNGCPPSAL
jgi:hypothetical protein